MQIPFKVAYKKLPSDIKTPEMLSSLIIQTAISLKFPHGMPNLESRMWAQVLDQLYEEKVQYIEVNLKQFLFIKETIEAAQMQPHWASWKMSFLDHLEAIEKNIDRRKER